MSNPWMQFKGVSFTYDGAGRRALKNINLTFYRGEKVLIIGANASGKSTLVRALRGKLGTDEFPGEYEGEIVKFDLDMETMDATIMADAVDHHLEEATTITNGRKRSSDYVPNFSEELKRRILEHPSDANLKFEDLSEGQRDIQNFVNNVNYDQSVFIFDEPLANLAPRAGQVFIDLVDDIHHNTDATIVMVEYRIEEVLSRPVDRVIVLSEGRVIFDGDPEKLLKRNILNSLGVGEPSYVSAIRYTGYPLEKLRNISNVNYVHGPDLKRTVESWLLTVPNFVQRRSDKAILTLENVSYTYPGRERSTLTNVSTEVYEGDMISIVGKNGSGKSTLGQIMDGNIVPDEGKVFWHGEEVTTDNLCHMKNETVYIQQNIDQRIIGFTVNEYLRDIAQRCNYSEEEAAQVIRESLKTTGLMYAAEMRIGQLSFGQQKRVMLSSALVNKPSLLIIDEPSEGQDFHHYNEFMQYLYQINQERKIAIIINTHNMDLILEFTRQTWVLSEGELIADTKPIRVATDHRLIQKAFLSESNLYVFARQIGLMDPYNFIRKFMDYHREINR
ncbi:ATP-binding cassette domain-containing protein [Aerococcus agrisoli]|uniref:ATP-binding cassette domain-containing protein n=1 Tax=Aerococcus agrisoli TaxID=2487350 RepID=A0A3N4GLF9_9LACT|nr:ABC transporter ATP-binding protein [Aerococcus agrisoli]RPA63672.1 ATP-binding cassette domain-containing protein [Aerococcus agrisoli]